jgi:hypothetical protein
MTRQRLTSGSGPVLLAAFLLLTGSALVFAFVPLVECHRCDSEGQFSRDAIIMGKPAIYIDYCDCGTFWNGGKRAKISLLRSLMKPQSLKMDRGDR